MNSFYLSYTNQNNNLSANKTHISSLIPHRDPIVMIDNLIESTETSTTTNFNILAENIFVEDQKFQESGFIENIAQTALAGSQYQLNQKGEAMKLAFIGEIKSLKIFQSINVGQIITTKTEIIHHVFNITLIRATVSCDNELVATCDMKLVTEA